MTVLALIALASIAMGVWSGRWVALVVPACLLAVYYGGLIAGSWGNGVGDAWQVAALFVGAVITSGTAVAVAVARSTGAARARRRTNWR